MITTYTFFSNEIPPSPANFIFNTIEDTIEFVLNKYKPLYLDKSDVKEEIVEKTKSIKFREFL